MGETKEASSASTPRRSCWFWEDRTDQGCILSEAGLSAIQHHQYKPSSYTPLDNFLNPSWTWLTDHCIPLWMAPNVVTCMGGFWCLLSYLVTWYFLPNFGRITEATHGDIDDIPNWMCWFVALCTILYYNLDCMDGKQARRTGQSSPLGQLFDHGMDCLCTLAHLSSQHTFLQAGRTIIYPITHFSLQFTFFMAQWEEYHTGVLPHSTGGIIGVTEVNYGMALLCISNAFVDRKTFFTKKLDELFQPIIDLLLQPESATRNYVVSILSKFQTVELQLVIWCLLMVFLIVTSMQRTYQHFNGNLTLFVPALSKLVPTLCIGYIMIFVYAPSEHSFLSSTFSLSEQETLYEQYTFTRYSSLATGFTYCVLTNKIIVFSMAKMNYASLQLDAVIFCLLVSLVSYDLNQGSAGYLTPLTLSLAWKTLTLGYLVRFLWWNVVAMKQIATKLNIHIFSIPPPKKQQ